MKKLTIIILSGLIIFSCGKSPDSLAAKADKYDTNSEYDNAIKAYQLLIDKFPDDSLAQSAMYNIAWIELDDKHNYDKGYADLNQIATKYPETPIGKSATDDIDKFPHWLMAKTSELRADTSLTEAMNTLDYIANNFSDNEIIPEALYLKGNILLNDKRDFYRAINVYQEIVQKFKGSSFEPMAQFMIGYIYANVQSDLPKAEIAYKTFLQKYPEHELAPSVKFELEYLGKQIKNIDELKTR